MTVIILIVITLIILQQQCDAYVNTKKIIVHNLKSTLIEYNNNNNNNNNNINVNENINNIKNAHTIRFQGGGIKFWFQAGACKYCREQQKIFNQTLIGTSAGSLSATFLALNVDFDKVAEFAIFQATRDHLFDKPSGLLGIWGNLVREWLYYLISDDAFTDYKNDKNKSNLYIAVTPFSMRQTFKNGRHPIYLSDDSFETKSELIDACMTSVHIPLFMDGKLYAKYKGKRYIDGSFWPLLRNQYQDKQDMHLKWPTPIYNIDWRNDVLFTEKFSNSFVDLITPAGLYEMMDFGYNYMKSEYEKE